MKIIALVSLVSCLGLIGCNGAPTSDSQLAGAHVHVIAQPKAGVKETLARVPVYDAAPAASAATGTYERVDYSKLNDIIVWLEPAEHTPTLGHQPLVVKISNTKPSEFIHAASVGQPLLLENATGRPLKLYSVSEGNEFDLSPIEPRQFDDSFHVKAEGLIEVLYDPAQPPIAQIYAAPSLWVARARSGQTVKFDDVPPGEYKVIAWHPRLPSATSTASLRAREVTKSTITIGVNALADPPR